MKTPNSLRYTIIFTIIIIPIVLLILPATFFDKGESICVSVQLLNQECPGCGMTRAIQHLLHLEIYEAWFYNKLSFIILPLLVYLGIKEIIRNLQSLKE